MSALMVVFFLALAPARAETGGDTADSADTGEAPEGRDTDPFEDTATAESVFVQDVGCGGKAASLGLFGALGALGLAGGRRRA